MSWMNLITCGVRFFAFVWADLPTIVMRTLDAEDKEAAEEGGHSNEDEDEELPVDTLEDVVWIENYKPKKTFDLGSLEEEEEVEEGETLSSRKRRAAFLSGTMWYELGFVIFPIIAVATDEPLFTIYSLFEICGWEGSRTILDAIFLNVSKMFQAIILGVLMIYSWMVLGMLVLKDAHKEELCSNMFQCMTSYVDITIRGNGVRDIMTEIGEDLRYSSTLVEQISASSLA
jgi:hypothetical protein